MTSAMTTLYKFPLGDYFVEVNSPEPYSKIKELVMQMIGPSPLPQALCSALFHEPGVRGVRVTYTPLRGDTIICTWGQLP